MEHENSSDGKHHFNFSGPDEIGTIAAVFSDYIEGLELKGNDSSVNSYDRKIAAWDEQNTLAAQYTTAKPRRFQALLIGYADGTEEVVNDIMKDAENTREMRVAKTSRRYRFGYHAGELAVAVSEHIDAATAVPRDDTE